MDEYTLLLKTNLLSINKKYKLSNSILNFDYIYIILFRDSNPVICKNIKTSDILFIAGIDHPLFYIEKQRLSLRFINDDTIMLNGIDVNDNYIISILGY